MTAGSIAAVGTGLPLLSMIRRRRNRIRNIPNRIAVAGTGLLIWSIPRRSRNRMMTMNSRGVAVAVMGLPIGSTICRTRSWILIILGTGSPTWSRIRRIRNWRKPERCTVGDTGAIISGIRGCMANRVISPELIHWRARDLLSSWIIIITSREARIFVYVWRRRIVDGSIEKLLLNWCGLKSVVVW